MQQYLRGARPPRRAGQRWATVLRNHADDSWACDCLPVTDVLFRPVYAFFVIAHGSRRAVPVGVTRHPTDAWAAQQVREAPPCERRPRYLSHDNDSKYGGASARVAEASGVEVRRTADRAPRENAIGERFLGGVRRECLDHLLVLGAAHLRRLLHDDVRYSNAERPHQGLRPRLPDRAGGSLPQPPVGGRVRAVPVLGGLHHAYRRVA